MAGAANACSHGNAPAQLSQPPRGRIVEFFRGARLGSAVAPHVDIHGMNS